MGFVSDVVGGLTAWTVGDFVHRHRLDDLLAAEPPVVLPRVVLLVIEGPIRRGFALGHMPMLTPLCKAVANQGAIAAVRPSKCWCIKGFRCGHQAPVTTSMQRARHGRATWRVGADILGLPPLTDNDRFAQPMNEYSL